MLFSLSFPSATCAGCRLQTRWFHKRVSHNDTCLEVGFHVYYLDSICVRLCILINKQQFRNVTSVVSKNSWACCSACWTRIWTWNWIPPVFRNEEFHDQLTNKWRSKWNENRTVWIMEKVSLEGKTLRFQSQCDVFFSTAKCEMNVCDSKVTNSIWI